jgi:hypothetical protein
MNVAKTRLISATARAIYISKRTQKEDIFAVPKGDPYNECRKYAPKSQPREIE